ncbi:MAG TPA: hypothetical protein VF750_08465 [Sphingomicrobium sp.]
MRVLIALFALTIALPAVAAGPNSVKLTARPSPQCPKTSSYVADGAGIYRGHPPRPKKLTELPPAKGYMAVYRRIGGCEYPMTMVEYRNPQRR